MRAVIIGLIVVAVVVIAVALMGSRSAHASEGVADTGGLPNTEPVRPPTGTQSMFIPDWQRAGLPNITRPANISVIKDALDKQFAPLGGLGTLTKSVTTAVMSNVGIKRPPATVSALSTPKVAPKGYYYGSDGKLHVVNSAKAPV